MRPLPEHGFERIRQLFVAFVPGCDLPIQVRGRRIGELLAILHGDVLVTNFNAMFSRNRYSVARRTAERRFFPSFVIGDKTV